MNHRALSKQQFWLLLFLSLWFLSVTPHAWRLTPDSGIYVGTAQALAESGQYRFNGHPNLLYYPGFSALLAAPILLFGVDFRVLHLVCAAVGLLGLWLVRAYFPASRYGWAGLLVPLLVACSNLVQHQVFLVLSDGTFLASSLAALLLWRAHEERGSRWALVGCIALAAYASLVRFQGLFLCAALAGALGLRALRRRPWRLRRVATAAALGLAAFVPFALWTWRNFVQHTPDTFNMANQLFFGLEGLRLYGPGFMRAHWIEQEWHYGFYNLMALLTRLPASTLGTHLVQALPRWTLTAFAVGAIGLGARRWLRRASGMERLYVPLSVAYLVVDALSSRDLYVVDRYWLPVLPFLLVSAMLGLGSIHRRLRGTLLEHAYVAVLVVLVALMVTRGFREGLPWGSDEPWEKTHEIIAELAAFVQQRTGPEVSVATSDWGPLPLALQRTSYQVINDATHRLTLERMERYQNRYLVVLDTGGPLPRSAIRMARSRPWIFREVLRVKREGSGTMGLVYSVDLARLSAFLRQPPQRGAPAPAGRRRGPAAGAPGRRGP